MCGNERKLNIVIADDNISDQQLLRAALEKMNINCECSAVFNGLQLMDFLNKTNAYKNQNGTPDLIFLDIGMPFMNGLGVLFMLKQDAALSKIPVYIISGGSEAELQKCRSLGAKACYEKPTDINGYYGIIQDITLQNLVRATS